jgi:lysophospholipase L1-like esterase
VMTRRIWWALGGFVVLAAVVLVLVLVVVVPPPPEQTDEADPPVRGPLTVVLMGDSTLSGEGAGNYSLATSGRNGNWCFRSPRAAVHQLQLPNVIKTVNLACSGAPSAQVALGDTTQWTEPSQARQLSILAKTHQIAAVVVAVGANDDPHFSRLVSSCFRAWLMDNPPCSKAVSQHWQQRLDAMAPKVARALGDIKKVLREEGYDRTDYELVQLSYASPVAPGIPEYLRSLNGCPFHKQDLKWVRSEAVESLSATLRDVATRVGARFLDLSDAGVGHEACTGGADPSTEWFNRLIVDWDDLKQINRASHASHGSFHPNAEGHTQVARCISDFLPTQQPAATCLTGPDGNLQAVTKSRS